MSTSTSQSAACCTPLGHWLRTAEGRKSAQAPRRGVLRPACPCNAGSAPLRTKNPETVTKDCKALPALMGTVARSAVSRPLTKCCWLPLASMSTADWLPIYGAAVHRGQVLENQWSPGLLRSWQAVGLSQSAWGAQALSLHKCAAGFPSSEQAADWLPVCGAAVHQAQALENQWYPGSEELASSWLVPISLGSTSGPSTRHFVRTHATMRSGYTSMQTSTCTPWHRSTNLAELVTTTDVR